MPPEIDLARRSHAMLVRAMELDAPARRGFVRAECAGDAPLLARVLELLDAADRADRFLDRPALDSLAPQPPQIPDAVGDYLVVGVLGAGGMATVYEAIQSQPYRRVALKVLHQSMTRQDVYQRFRFETEALARLQHPGIAQIYEAGAAHLGQAAPAPFFAMELVPGARTITAHADAARLSPRQRLAMLADVCDAVHHGHQRGIIHRDLKPANVLVGDGGCAKVIDFGVARTIDARPDSPTAAIGEPQLIGTLSYMSPEQCSPGTPIDIRADVYSLGVLLYELLTGRLPHDVKDKPIPAALHAIVSEPPRRPHLRAAGRDDPDPRALEAVILKAIERDPDRRYDSASALATDIRRLLASEPVEARPPGTLEQIRLFARRNRGVTTAAVAVVGSIALIAAVSTAFALRLNQEVGRRRTAEQAATAERDLARWHAYTANISGALAAMNTGEFQQMRTRLAGAYASRGWEWGFLSRLADRALRTVNVHDDMVLDMAVAPDGAALATCAADGSVRTWDVASGQMLASSPPPLPGAQAPRAHALAYTADGRHLLVGDGAGAVRLLDAATLRTSRAVADLRSQIRSIAALPDGRIAIAATSGAAVIYDPGTDLLAPWPDDQPGGVTGLAVSDDGRWIATSNERSLVALRRASDLDIARTLEFPAAVAQVRFSRDSSMIAAVGSSGRMLIWRTETGEILHTIEASGGINTVRSVAFSSDGSKVAAGLIHRGIVVFSLPDGQKLGQIGGHAEAVSGLLFHDADHLLTSTSWDGTMRTWRVDEIASPGGTTTLAAHTDHVFALAFSPDGTTIASAGSDGMLHVWDADLARPLAAVSPTGLGLAAVAWSPDGATLAVAGRTAEVVLYDAATLDELDRLPARDRGAASLAFSPDGQRLAVGCEDGVTLIHRLDGAAQPLELTRHDARVNSVRFSPDGALVATGSRDHTVRLWHADTGESAATFGDHDLDVFAVLFSPDGRRLYSGSRDQTVRVWDVASRTPLRTLSGHGQYVTSLALSPDNTRLAAGSWFGEIVLFDVGTLDMVASFRAHDSAIRSVGFSPDGRFLASASYDHTIKLFDSIPREQSDARRRDAVAAIAAAAAALDATPDPSSTNPSDDQWTRKARLLRRPPP